MVNKVRELFGLYNTTTRLIVHLPRIHGGLGIKKISHVYYTTRISFQVKMLNHDETIFSNIAKNSLLLDMKKEAYMNQMKAITFWVTK